ncbi:hypothetical protein AJ88_17585 [Mesorhizobium amorphae CCBAU 01583]|nr:hypothetical protein AJ88_17585 [Mesorhizobium amorphae CCBAU 01583]
MIINLNAYLFRLLCLDRSDERSHHFSNLFASQQQFSLIVSFQQTDPACQQYVRFQFLQRPLRHAQKLNERTSILTTVPFGDVGGVETAERRIWEVIP